MHASERSSRGLDGLLLAILFLVPATVAVAVIFRQRSATAEAAALEARLMAEQAEREALALAANSSQAERDGEAGSLPVDERSELAPPRIDRADDPAGELVRELEQFAGSPTLDHATLVVNRSVPWILDFEGRYVARQPGEAPPAAPARADDPFLTLTSPDGKRFYRAYESEFPTLHQIVRMNRAAGPGTPFAGGEAQVTDALRESILRLGQRAAEAKRLSMR